MVNKGPDYLRVACAVILRDKHVLVVQRGLQMRLSGKWEFPGGKIEQGESVEDCIVREIHEELSMDISVLEQWPSVFHDYGDQQIELVPLLCSTTMENPVLKEHQAFVWADLVVALRLEWAAADMPVRDMALNHLTSA
jgi:8-oxo-dGTP diphosphatase